MAGKISYIFLFLIVFAVSSANAQELMVENQDTEKLRGSRFIPYPSYPGSPFLNEKFLLGEIQFRDGTSIGNIGLNYGTYRDELIYYNTSVSAQIAVDKASLSGFTFTDTKGNKRIFRRQLFTGSFLGDCYFEVLSDGNIAVLAYRKVNLEASDTYYSKTGMAYQPAYSYYLYKPGKGYAPIKINRNSLLSKFGKPDQKVIRRVLRKNGVIILDEASYLRAWNLVMEIGLVPNL